MMFCPNCGYQHEGDVAFCQNCGAPMQASTAPYGAPVQQPVMRPAAPQPMMPLDVMRSLIRSPLYLVSAICFTVSLLLSVVATITASSGVLRQLYQLMSLMGMDYQYMQVFDVIHSAVLPITLVSMIPSIVIAIGLWMIFASAGERKTAGLTMIKVVVILNTISVIIAMAAMIVGVLIAIVAAAEFQAGAAPIGVLVGVLIVGVLVFGLMIGFLTALRRMINRFKIAILGNVAESRISMYVVVIDILAGIYVIPSSVATGSVLAILANIAMGCAMILFAVELILYRSRMQQMNAPQRQPQQVPYSVPQPMRPDTGWQTYQREDHTAAINIAAEVPGTSELDRGAPAIDSGTTVLNQTATVVIPHLVRMKDQSKVYVTANVFRMGKAGSDNEYGISDNPAISRHHADIINRNGQYFIVDCNSTNHVFINGGMIPPGVEIPLTQGMHLRLANEEFVFAF